MLVKVFFFVLVKEFEQGRQLYYCHHRIKRVETERNFSHGSKISINFDDPDIFRVFSPSMWHSGSQMIYVSLKL